MPTKLISKLIILVFGGLLLLIFSSPGSMPVFAANNSDQSTSSKNADTVTQFCKGKLGKKANSAEISSCSYGYFLAFGNNNADVSTCNAPPYNKNLAECKQGFNYGQNNAANISFQGQSNNQAGGQNDNDCLNSSTGCTDPAADPKAKCDLDSCDFIVKYVNPGINLLTAVFGLIAAGSLIMGGIQFTTSEGDPQKAASAKNRIAGTIFAIFAYAFIYSFLQFLIPGGIFNRS